MLLGLVHPTNGDIAISGMKLDKHKTNVLKKIGAVVERPDLYTYLSAWDNLNMFAKLSEGNISKQRIKEVIDLVGLNR